MTNSVLTNGSTSLEQATKVLECWPCFARLHVFGAVSLFLVLNITFKHSHDYTAIFLVLGSWALFVHAAYVSGVQAPLQDHKKGLLIILMVYLTVSILPLMLWAEESSSLDTESKILLIIPVIFLLHRFPPPFKLVRLGILLGSIALAISAAYEIHELGRGRPGGHAQLIQYGAIAMTIGLMGLVLALSIQHTGWRVLAYLAACGALYASFVNGSRGAWVVLPLAILVLYFQLITVTNLPKWKTLFALVGICIIGASIVLNTDNIAKKRIDRAVLEIEWYQSGENKNTSLGFRLEMWKAAWEAGKRSPWFGNGKIGYEEVKQELIDQGLVVKRIKPFGHAHNGFLDAWAKGGALKLACLLALVFYPVILGLKYIRDVSVQQKSIGYSLVMLGLSIISINLSQGFFSHNIGMIFYLVILVILTSNLIINEELFSDKG